MGLEQLLVKIALGGGGVTSVVIAALIWMSRHTAVLRTEAQATNETLLAELRRQIGSLQGQVETMRTEHREECDRLRRERDLAQIENARLEVSLERLRMGGAGGGA